MPFNTNTGVWYDDQRVYNPGPVTAGPSNDRIVRDQFYGAPAPAQGSGDPNAPAGTGQTIGLPAFDLYTGPQSQMGSQGMGYYGYPAGQEAANPFGDIGRSLEDMMRALQEGLDEQRRAWLEESSQRLSELNKLEELKKKRLLLGAKGRAGNILSAGSGITASGAPVSRAVLY